MCVDEGRKAGDMVDMPIYIQNAADAAQTTP